MYAKTISLIEQTELPLFKHNQCILIGNYLPSFQHFFKKISLSIIS